MRVCVLFRGTTVRRPPGVTDAVAAIGRVHLQNFFKIAKLARSPPNSQLLVILVNGDSGRIVTAVLKLLQTAKNDRNRSLRSYVPHDSAHDSIVRNVPAQPLAKHFDAIVFDDRIAQDFPGDTLKILPFRKGDLEEFPLAYLLDSGVAKAFQG
jgi:hypothetical protein